MGKSGIDFQKLDERTAQRPKYEYVTITDTEKQFRFLQLDGADSFRTYNEHFVEFKNGWKRSISCPDFDNQGERTCIICTAKTGPGNGILKTSLNLKFLANVIERTDEGDDKLKLFKISSLLMTSLKTFLDRYETLGDRDYIISQVENPDPNSKLKKVYIVKEASKKAIPLSDEDKALAKNRYPLDVAEPSYNERDLASLMLREAGSSNGNSSSSSNLAEEVKNLLDTVKPESKSEEKANSEEEEPKELLSLLDKYRKK